MSEENKQRIGDYEILGVLGAGGMGQVFKVRNVISDRIEAMKILLPDLAGRQDLAERFLREIKVLAALDHPNIAALRTALTLGNQLVMVMEYVEGTTLAKRLEQGLIPPEEALNYIGQVLDALTYAHSRNVIHRDIKPANMMLTPGGVIKLMDFGIARSADDHSLTSTGTTLGSLYYMSPEQVQGTATDARSDLYSVGVSLYEMVTGERPFHGTSEFSLMAAQVQQAPKPPIELRSDLPAALSDIILTAMAKDPAQRFQSAAAFRNALNSVRTTLFAAAPPKTPAVEPIAAMGSVTAMLSGNPAVSGVWAAGSQAPSQDVPPVSAQPEVVPSAAQISAPSTHRGLYMTLGALIVLAALLVAGLYVPRWSKAGASGQKEKQIQVKTDEGTSGESQQNPANASGTEQKTTQQGENSSATGANAVQSEASGSTSSQPAQVATQPGQGQAGSAAKTVKKVQKTIPSVENAAQLEKDATVGASVRTKAGVTDRDAISPQPGGGSQADQTTSQSPLTSSSGQLQQLEQEMDQLSARANSVSDTLDQLRQQQSAKGLGLRGDIASTQELMKSHMAKAQMALQNQDAGSAKRYLDLAESEVGRLEKFLGH